MDSAGEGKLVEFALDTNLKIPGVISGVPNQQQFPVKDTDGKMIASGCVPTAAIIFPSVSFTGNCC